MSRFRSERVRRFEESRTCQFKGITSNDAGVYRCHECGDSWQSYDRFAWWPIEIGWHWPESFQSWFSHHGAQIGSDGLQQRVFARFIRIGPVIFKFGWREEYR